MKEQKALQSTWMGGHSAAILLSTISSLSLIIVLAMCACWKRTRSKSNGYKDMNSKSQPLVETEKTERKYFAMRRLSTSLSMSSFASFSSSKSLSLPQVSFQPYLANFIHAGLVFFIFYSFFFRFIFLMNIILILIIQIFHKPIFSIDTATRHSLDEEVR